MATRHPTEATEGVAERRFGIYAIALLQAVSAGSHATGILAGLDASVFGGLDSFSTGAYALLIAAAGLVVAYGLLRLRRWAWVATMLWVGLAMAEQLLFYLRNEDTNYVVMAVSIIQVFYLNLSDVQAAFARTPAAEAAR
jgi:hypothetical protein